MNPDADNALAMTFADAERTQLRAWMALDASAKIDFFEEMIELAFISGALQPHRLALRDAGQVLATAARAEGGMREALHDDLIAQTNVPAR